MISEEEFGKLTVPEMKLMSVRAAAWRAEMDDLGRDAQIGSKTLAKIDSFMTGERDGELAITVGLMILDKSLEGVEELLQDLKEGANKQYDMGVEACCKLVRELTDE